MTNCIIIHGCPSIKEKGLPPEQQTFDKHRMPWAKQQLEQKGITTHTPKMPAPRYPDYEAYKQVFEQYEVTEESILIGHSCGCTFLVHRLGESKQPVHKLILVAPWKITHGTDTIGRAIREKFYTYTIDPSIQERVEQITMFTADNEKINGKKSLEIFHEAIGGKIISLSGHGHYTYRDMETEEFPELIEQVVA